MNERHSARATRVGIYSGWLKDDADGLAFNLMKAASDPIEGAPAILKDARQKLVTALEQIDRAIATHTAKEPA
jgi:hypothetical protein